MNNINRDIQADNFYNINFLNHTKTSIFNQNSISFGIYPFQFYSVYNSKFPKGENNAAAWYGRGFNYHFSGGVFLTSKFFSIDINPMYIYQENKDFLYPRFIRIGQSGNVRYLHEGILNAIDAPFRFGTNSFTTFDWGHSSVRLHYNKIDIGVGTQSLVWGPSIHYPLVMSGNAPGFIHFFLRTNSAIRIPRFGKFEFYLLGGYPRESIYFQGQPGSGNVRFNNGINISFKPTIVNNITLGFIRYFHLYETDGFRIHNMFRVFDPLTRESLISAQGSDGVREQRNQILSVYFHLFLPETNAEIYAEFFREDHSFNFRDLFVQPHHNSAYNFGFQKIFYASFADFYVINLEITNLTASQLNQVRPQDFFYTHSNIRQGHTNKGQILGAAIGPGSNSQLIRLLFFKDQFMFNILTQRAVINDTFHFRMGSVNLSPFREFGDYYNHRVDLNISSGLSYSIKNLTIHGNITWTKAFNYGRFDYGNFSGIPRDQSELFDRTNINFLLGVVYSL